MHNDAGPEHAHAIRRHMSMDGEEKRKLEAPHAGAPVRVRAQSVRDPRCVVGTCLLVRSATGWCPGATCRRRRPVWAIQSGRSAIERVLISGSNTCGTGWWKPQDGAVADGSWFGPRLGCDVSSRGKMDSCSGRPTHVFIPPAAAVSHPAPPPPTFCLLPSQFPPPPVQ